jgi:hypothetical protein
MRSTVILVLLFLAGGTTTFGQISVVSGKDDKGQVIQPNVIFGKQELIKPTQVPGILPNEPMTFLFHSTKEFVRRDDSVEVTLVSMVNSQDAYLFNGKICKAGIDGEWSGSKRSGCSDFYPDVGYTGRKQGLSIGERIKMYTRTFNEEDLNGKYNISVKVYNSLGVLVQEPRIEVYLTDTGTVPRPYYITKIEVSPDGHSLTATGKFRIGAPYYCLVGVLSQGFVIFGNNPMYASYSTDGLTLSTQSRVWYYRPTAEDVVIMTPGDPAMTKPGGHVEVAYIP